jgi:predicted NBD/HSP70 family sugar kinase
VLNLIRTRQPASRADLARASGMQRSTISLIVEDLIRENWVLEGPAVRLPRGRRPTFLRLNEERAIVGVDIRPGQTMVALADVNGKFGVPEVMATPRDPAVAICEIIRRIQGLIKSCGDRKIEGIGISLPGRYDRGLDRLVFAPNLGWRDVDLKGPVAAATGLDVELENAANACVLAAVWFDHVESFRNLVVLTVSEGIGAGILVNGQLAMGLGGMAGEFGHVAVDPEGPSCSCGSRGCWEVFASNRAAVRYYRETTSPPEEVAFSELLVRADAGDSLAVAAVEKMAEHLGSGMRLIVASLAPERIIVIGDLTRAWERFGPVLEAKVAEQVLPGGQAPQVIPAHEDGFARLRGTVALVLKKHFQAA